MDGFRESAEICSHKLYIDATDKDWIMDQLLKKANNKGVSILDYNDVKLRNLSRGQFDSIISSFIKDDMIRRENNIGYGSKFVLCQGIYDKKDMGGFVYEKQIYLKEVAKLESQLLKLQKELNPSLLEKINKSINDAKTIYDIIPVLKSIASLLMETCTQ